MDKKVKDAIMASFIADALSLGVHWVYNTSEIEKKYGRLEQMVKPELAPYHNFKAKGEFTHYGDQMMALLESVQRHSGFDINGYLQDWQALFQNYNGYFDHATTITLENIDSQNGGSDSSDLSGAARIAPLSLYYSDNLDAFVEAAKMQTAMTHNNPIVLDTAEFFARMFVLVLNENTPTKAIEKSLEAMPNSIEIHQMTEEASKTVSLDTPKAISQLGQACSVQGALQSTIHIILKYENNLEKALVENINSGGDSSARGMLTGFILGAYNGISNLPQSWLDDMKTFNQIKTILDTI